MNEPRTSHGEGRGIEVSTDGGIVRVTVRGQVSWLMSAESVARALAGAAVARTRRILFDIRPAYHSDFHAVVLHHADRAWRVGLLGMRIAVLGRGDDPMLPFIETVAANRAIEAGVFVEDAAAIAWLQGDARPPAG